MTLISFELQAWAVEPLNLHAKLQRSSWTPICTNPSNVLVLDDLTIVPLNRFVLLDDLLDKMYSVTMSLILHLPLAHVDRITIFGG